ncbi:MAG: NAD(P)H-hydrate dehydratase [Gemmatimonadaceae bacterium]|nr:NAD(P)H-hydrate dehydratase [Gemmatimonadaceae bacterium]MCW5827410.1 NAD(P)H-hydrate dehydratase [Gemmatimonadaceae bacterium]
MPVRVTTAAEAAARDAAAIAAGTPSYALMQAAGGAAARWILSHYPAVRTDGALCVAGAGNNGGDAWVVAGVLAAAGCPVGVVEAAPPSTNDATRARGDVRPRLAEAHDPARPAVVVDGLLGTGASGELRESFWPHLELIAQHRANGAVVVALDAPSGIDATTGAGGRCVRADATLTFGTVKRGLLLRRDEAGAIACLDIGLGEHAAIGDGAPTLVDEAFVRAAIPPIPADAHKGVRRRLAVVGGGEGMAGAPMLAARGAMRSGIGMVQLLVAPTNVPVVQAALPETMAARWPVTAEDQGRVLGWTHCLLLGPGLGRTAMTRALIERLLVEWQGPVVLDADALNVFEGEPRTLGSLLGARPAIVTPHPVEAGRLLRRDVATVSAARFEVGTELAKQLGATVILKGVPSVISSPDGRVAVSASGSPTLGTAGSGDVLAGIVATLLAQTGDAFAAAASGAWIHGRAGEFAASQGSVRGTSLEDVVVALREAWRLDSPPLAADVLAELPAAGHAR